MPSREYDELGHLSVTVERGLATVRSKVAGQDDFEHSFFSDIRDVFVPLGRDPDVRAVVLAVENPPVSTNRFALEITKASLEQRANRFLTIQQFFTAQATFRKPVVAGVIGHVHGITAVVALLSDSVVASTAATFGDTHVGIGLSAGDGGTSLWPFLVGPGLARQVLLEGRQVTASEALALGIVAEVVEPGAVLAAAAARAERLGNLPRVAFMSTKLAINNHFRLSALIASDLAAAYEAATVVEPEFADRQVARMAGKPT